MNFKIGDKLQALEFDKEQYGIKWVRITSINEDTKVYHWVVEWNGGILHSGYFFHEAILY